MQEDGSEVEGGAEAWESTGPEAGGPDQSGTADLIFKVPSFLDHKILESAFTSQLVVYSESDMPVHVRWQMILENIPEMRTRSLTDDLSDIYDIAYNFHAGLKLHAAKELAVLATRYWYILFTTKRVLKPTAELQWENAQYWQRKLLDRLNETAQVRRKGDRIRKERVPETKALAWVH